MTDKTVHNIVIGDNGNMGRVSPLLFGNNLEHTRSSINKGLSAQMLRNRKFAGKPSVMEGVATEWFLIGERTYAMVTAPFAHHDSEHYHMHRRLECGSQFLLCCDPDKESGFGQHGLDISKDEKYSFAMTAKCADGVQVTVSLTDRYNTKTYASTVINVDSKEWGRYEACLSVSVSDPDASLRIFFKKQTSLFIGSVSLMNSDNFRGMRKDAVAAMKEIGIKILRWPGGNFAGEYNWFDGLLPVDERSPLESYQTLETQPHSMGYDYHEINTDDFVALCREIGAEPFITINPTWSTPEENAAWVEYCNGDENTVYGKIRAERGYKEPFNVRYWSLGNEFGYGHMEGENTAAGYARIARQNAEKMLEADPDITFCSSGPYPNKDWIDNSANNLSDIAEYVSYHTYSPNPSYADPDKIKDEYLRALQNIRDAREAMRYMRENLRDGIHLSFDEWNLWYAWYRKSTVIDGMHAAVMLNMIIGEAPKLDIGIACNFEAVNEGAIKVWPHRTELTATGKMIRLMSSHMNGDLLYSDDSVTVTEKDGIKTVTAINESCENPAEYKLDLGGEILYSRLYEGKTLMPLSDFEEGDLEVRSDGDSSGFVLPPLSVAIIRIR